MNTYFADIEYHNTSYEWTHYCSGPIIALNEFHRIAQKTGVLIGNRRKKLRWDEYKIVRLWREGVEYDLPNTPNPDLHAKPVVIAPVDLEFDAMPEKGEGRLAP